ncbi:sirohydrochlorin chelatase [Methylococcus capsulatus]|uniref:sirohydrochlorin chelatase n=1 Tax=Methylococcus capsulatus TaxID=414 RepID=UPI001C5305CA|nr:sirohydrochlorin chelatase [Methylococcus capsulatus]QXP87117.1 sirohydrochlorin chelatase [Methylococcus capsulatus]QXP93203.1 sirohydrochlorin chelatase [Methylococcus capsulatus]
MNPRDTVLLVGHGSRESAGNREIEQFAEKWRERRPGWRIEVCFIEFADVLLDEGLDRAARHGGRVLVAPLILNAAGHVKMEIPEAIEHARLRHPQVEFVYARHLGACEEILAILKRNLRKAMSRLDMPDPRNTGIVLLGRGSSDRVANGEVARMARWLFEEGEHPLVDIAFTGITHPRLESVVQRQVRLDMGQIVILPYYLFTGTLIERIKRQAARLQQQYPRVHFALGDYFGFEEEVYALLEQRLAEATGAARAMMECDGCKYREFAAEHGGGHHHHDHHAA